MYPGTYLFFILLLNNQSVTKFPYFKFRLTFWLSNTVVLRGIISQAFGVSSYPSYVNKNNNKFSPQNGNLNGLVGKQIRNLGILPFMDDWQETSTFTRALEKIESWLFTRIVESIWWQVTFSCRKLTIYYKSQNSEGKNLLRGGSFSGALLSLFKKKEKEKEKRIFYEQVDYTVH